MAYDFTNSRGQKYYLHSKEVILRGSGKKQTIYYFSREMGSNAIELPQGFEAMEVQKTGLPVLKKK
ncbi:hypothetical protein HYW42_00535 [Candidatus Daviesbacteria bacterium]|nr:hypothetical protein [Candidatus Daviesbacteria bacterium]